MTISSTTNRSGPYNGNGVTTVFARTFLVKDADHLKVFQEIDGVSTEVTSGITKDGIGNASGNVTFTTAPVTGAKITLVRDIPLTQETDYSAQGKVAPEQVERDLDLQEMQLQDISEKVGRSIKLPLSSNLLDIKIPEPEVGKTLIGAAGGWETGPSTSEISAAQGYAERAENAAATVTATYQTIGALLAVTEALTVGQFVEAGGHRYEVVASGGDISSAANQFQVHPTFGWYMFDAFNPNKDGSTSDAAKLQTAVDRAAGTPLFVAAGTYLIDATVDMESGSSSIFNPGTRLHGAGEGATIFANGLSSAPMFDISAGGTPGSNFMMGCALSGFKVTKNGSPTSQVGIRMKTAYMTRIEHVHIDGLAGTGIHIPCEVGDNDGSNMVTLENVRVENCTSWGIDAAGNSGFNETSFIRMTHVFIQACGTADASYQPPSGGMKWKGQILSMSQCAFTLNENCAFWVPGEAGLGQSVMLRDTTFENNKQRAIFCRGIRAFKGRNLQFYSNDNFTMTNAVEFEAASFLVSGVDIKGVVVRATSGNNAYTAFKLSGANANFGTCKVSDVEFDEWGHAGQVKQSGFENDPVVNAAKTSAQSISGSMSAVVFNVENSDLQSRYNPTNGRYQISYVRWNQFRGQITLSGLAAGDAVHIELYDVSNAAAIAQTILGASGLTDETFHFDFTVEIGFAGTTRDYEIRAKQSNSGGSKALNVSSALNNVLTVLPLTVGSIG